MGFRAVRPDDLMWIERPREPDDGRKLVVDADGTPAESEPAEILEPVV